VDNSHNFNFGFFREQVVGGWPSSHTTVAVALAVTLIMLYPKSYFIKIFSLGAAAYISLGVTFGFHWFSEFVAGLLLGIVIGRVVGGYFKLAQK
jgi:membrane-associated phospholipid phosphatase